MLRIVYISLFALLLQNQGMAQARLPKRLRKQIPNCCNERPGLPLPFRTDGIYFESYELVVEPSGEKKANNAPHGYFYMFFEDGTIYRQTTTVSDYDSLLQLVKRTGREHKLYGIKDFGTWGKFKVCGDTIYDITVSKNSYLWGIFKLKYVVRDGKVERCNINHLPTKRYTGTSFIPYKDLPDPEFSWFRQQKCVSCEEKEQQKCP